MGFWKTTAAVIFGELVIVVASAAVKFGIDKHKYRSNGKHRAARTDDLEEGSPYGGRGKNEKGPKARMIGFGAND